MSTHKKPKKKLSLFITLLGIIGGGVLFIGVMGVGAFVLFAKDLPSPSQIEERFIVQSTKIYDRTGTVVLYDIFGEEKRTVIAYEEIPEHAKQATIAIEDQNFYQHPGIDLRAILRSALSNLQNDSLQGGSTITQQFIKNSILSPERTLTRKIKEAILALELERQYPKDAILGFYLNQIPYGSNAYGIEAAAQTYFEKHAKDLTLAEGALLAGLPKAPTYYSPYGSHLDELFARKNLVLQKMREMGFITPEQEREAKEEELEFKKVRSSISAPHFVFYVRELLEEKYGDGGLERAGLKIVTTLDWELQQAAEEIIEKQSQLNQQRGAYNASLVAVDPNTGQILAMVGSKDYFGEPQPAGCVPGVNCKFEPYVNVALQGRQPGSAFKPFVYATAFKEGYTDKTALFDLPTEFNSSCSPGGAPQVAGAICYHPSNFGGRFMGPVTVRQALANSLNVPAVKMLYLAGVDDSISTAQTMGISTLKDRSRFGLSLVLGAGEVKLLEMASAYGAFAAEGIRHQPTPILKIEDNAGNVLEEFETKPQRVLNQEVARTITSILSDNVARTPVFGPNSNLYFPDRPVAAKTGTTNEYRDGWTLGYTPSLVVGVWSGNNNNASMFNEPGSSVAAPIWRGFMEKAFSILSLPVEDFVAPAPVNIEKPVLNGQHIINNEAHTILYYIDKDNPLGDPPKTRDPLFNNWESSVRSWFGKSYQPPGSGEDGDGEDGGQERRNINVSIESPPADGVVSAGGFTVAASAPSDSGAAIIEILIDGVAVARVQSGGPFWQVPVALPGGIGPGERTLSVRMFGPNGAFGASSKRIIIAE